MRLIALLSWFDEPKDTLLSCIASLANCGVDHVVAVDGAYALYPDGKPASPAEQQAAIVVACRDLGMGCTLHVPNALWTGNEVEKRTFLFYLGLANADVGDWFMVQDADETIVRFPEDMRERLGDTDCEVATVTAADEGAIYTRRKLFAAQPIIVQGNHWTYVTLDGRYLWADREIEQVPSLNMTDFTVLHRPRRRPDGRLEAKKAYYDVRDSTAVELYECRKCGDKAIARIPINWRKDKGRLIAEWTEACGPCKAEIEKVNDAVLRHMGIKPESVKAKTVIFDQMQDPNMVGTIDETNS